MPRSVPLIARKPNNAPTEKFSLRACRQGSHIHLYWSGTSRSFIGPRGFTETGLDKIPGRTTDFSKNVGILPSCGIRSLPRIRWCNLSSPVPK